MKKYVAGLMLFWACSAERVTGDSHTRDTEDSAQITFWGDPPVLLSELVAVNLDLRDHRGADPSWVEFYNPSPVPVNLSGYALTERTDQIRQWVAGNVVVPAGGYAVVFLSGLDLKDPGVPADTISLMNSAVYSWADSQNDPPGRSLVRPYAFSGRLYAFTERGIQVSATLIVGDNRGTGLNWTAAKVFMGFRGFDESDALDLSDRTQLLVVGYIPKGKELGLRLAQRGLEDWKGWVSWIRGTGDSNGVYVVELPQGGFPDLSALWAVNFEAPPYVDTISFIVRDLRAVRTPRLAHGNFKLNRNGGFLWLVDSLGRVRDSVSYPALEGGVSWARGEDGRWGYRKPPTPWQSNGVNLAYRRAASLSVYPDGGFYAGPVSVTFSLPEGIQVRYTLDGSPPSERSPVYGGPIRLDTTTVLRAVALAPGNWPSVELMRTYFIADSATLPVVSIAVDPGAMFDPDTGLHVDGPNKGTIAPYYGANYWMDKELPVHLEFYEPGGRLGFSSGAGLGIFGNWSRSNSKKSLALFFREQYGNPALEYPLFPQYPQVRRFESFILRGGASNTGRDHIRDPLAQTLSVGLDVDYQKYRPAAVYINGKYWGIMDIREKLNAAYLKSNYGLEKEQVSLLRYNAVECGSDTGWEAFLDWIEGADMNARATRARVRETIDLNNYMNYMATEIFANNTDWPANNIKFWRAEYPRGRWRWILYDLDFGFGSNAGTGARADASFNSYPFVTATDGPDWPNAPRSTLLFRRLLQDSVFRADWINRLATLLSWQFAAPRVLARIDTMVAALGSHYVRDIERWGWRKSDFDRELENIRAFARARGGFLRQHTRSFFGLGADAPAVLNAEGGGQIQVNGLILPFTPFSGIWYAGHPLSLLAVEPPGKTFVGWSDGVAERERLWDPAVGGTLTARFR